MSYEIATATSAGAGGLAHYDLLDRIKTFATTNATLVSLGQAWTVLRYDTASANRELILQGPGLSGTEQIFVGIKCYQDVTLDYYNLCVATFTGYVSGNSFETQPGSSPVSGVPAHNASIDYWLSVNGQRINCALKVGTPVYTSFSIGKFFPFGRPSQFPQPLIAAGMLNGAPATRFSDTAYSFAWKGARANLAMRFVDGTWKQPSATPWGGSGTLANTIRPLDRYELLPIVLYDGTPNVYGQLDGVWQITGFGNSVESVVQQGGSSVIDPTGLTVKQTVDAIRAVSGRAFVVIQDVGRTGFGDFIAMEMA